MSDESDNYVYALVTEDDLIGLFSSPQQAREWAETNHVAWNGVTRILHRSKTCTPRTPGEET
ncbi:hypothetical protein [Propionivibrio limicola]|uniref:hypothetical protein n=1 Tax=Propionivibrio limicola TaxID=167645 RepID=UPI0012914705|nr:hypothetical protein [Propionivibrio limicola]